MKNIGILCASDTELEPFLNYIEIEQTIEKAMLKFYKGRIGKHPVCLLYTSLL